MDDFESWVANRAIIKIWIKIYILENCQTQQAGAN